ncbi:MAG TPA: type II toxin-antitoxin system VapC family toxin [Blastocatellia bacterium]|nr:type II toxin-antitoxin system VapC family toxin [Blastocatellia bacterium]
MTTYLLDTSVIIDVLNGKRDREMLLKGLLSQGDLLACCAVNVSEIYAGMRPKEETKTEALLQSLDYYEINWEVAKRAGLLKRDYSKKGQTLSLTDTTIAAVALEYNLMLITDNVKHYPMPQLKLYPLP